MTLKESLRFVQSSAMRNHFQETGFEPTYADVVSFIFNNSSLALWSKYKAWKNIEYDGPEKACVDNYILESDMAVKSLEMDEEDRTYAYICKCFLSNGNSFSTQEIYKSFSECKHKILSLTFNGDYALVIKKYLDTDEEIAVHYKRNHNLLEAYMVDFDVSNEFFQLVYKNPYLETSPFKKGDIVYDTHRPLNDPCIYVFLEHCADGFYKYIKIMSNGSLKESDGLPIEYLDYYSPDDLRGINLLLEPLSEYLKGEIDIVTFTSKFEGLKHKLEL